jgi:hypothetical protein
MAKKKEKNKLKKMVQQEPHLKLGGTVRCSGRVRSCYSSSDPGCVTVKDRTSYDIEMAVDTNIHK